MVSDPKLTKFRLLANKARRELQLAEELAAKVVMAPKHAYQEAWQEYFDACREKGYCPNCDKPRTECSCVLAGLGDQPEPGGIVFSTGFDHYNDLASRSSEQFAEFPREAIDLHEYFGDDVKRAAHADSLRGWLEQQRSGANMDEQKAREILGAAIKEDNRLEDFSPYISWRGVSDCMELDGTFTADDLEALAWWMRNIKAKT